MEVLAGLGAIFHTGLHAAAQGSYSEVVIVVQVGNYPPLTQCVHRAARVVPLEAVPGIPQIRVLDFRSNKSRNPCQYIVFN